MSELLPCPFCGGKVELHYAINYKGITEYYIACRSCCYMNFESSIEKAVSKWNTRHYPPEVQQAIERMKPKKVTYDDSSLGKPAVPEFWIAYCPECKQPIDFNDTPFEFCRRCGQRLDWSNDE